MDKAATKSTKALKEIKNIRVTNDGYQVLAVRSKVPHRKFFAGHTKKSLPEAEKYRDTLLKKVPAKRVSGIPPRVLAALGLDEPVTGVFRHPNRPHFGVAYTDESGHRCSRAFSFRNEEEEVAAYAKAMKFRKKTVRESLKRSGKSRR